MRRRRRGAALMVCLFIIFIVTLLVVNILDTEMLELSALRNTIDYEKALYLANAGVHHAAAELENALDLARHGERRQLPGQRHLHGHGRRRREQHRRDHRQGVGGRNHSHRDRHLEL